jgi:virginiamycin A acetyltransferase
MAEGGPFPNERFPMPGVERTGFLRNFITRPNIIVGDYTYYDDPLGPERFESNVLYHFEFTGDRLIIGRFCSIAAEVRFMMNGGNHPTSWLTTYPFPIFGHGWEAAMPEAWPTRGDTVVGHDVWFGYAALIMPGIHIGNGAIIASAAVVTKDVPPYAIVGGNPARIIRMRFDDATIARLEAVRWWDWDAEKITRNVRAICGSDIAELERAV